MEIPRGCRVRRDSDRYCRETPTAGQRESCLGLSVGTAIPEFGLENPRGECRLQAALLTYSSRNVFAGSIAAMRRVGTAVAMAVTTASTRTTVKIVVPS